MAVFPLKCPREAVHGGTAGQFPAAVAAHAVRQQKNQCILPGQNGKGILLIAAGTQNLVPVQSGDQKRFLRKRLLRHDGG